MHVELVARDGLLAKLLKATEPVVLVTAPAGSGKTVLMAQWAAQEARPVGWLHLDGADNDPLVFLGYLAVALDRVIGLTPEVLDWLQGDETPRRDDVLGGIATSLEAARPFGLVLDDCHLVQNDECWEPVRRLLEHLPEGATIALASRSGPPLPVARLKARGELLELRAPDLALDADEARELLALRGLPADDETVARLLQATEGWATGVYLGSLAGGSTGDEWLAHVRGDQEDIAAYLLDEVLEGQPVDLREFLERTSILDELTAPLCAAVTGRADSAAVLERLSRENLFVSALDDRGERYRYHHLFAELLRSRLDRHRPDELVPLHRRAAAWYEAHGEVEPAVRHYLLAGDVEATVDLAAAEADALLVRSLTESARRLLLLYTEEQLLAYPALAVAGVWVFGIAAGTREEQRRWAHLVETFDVPDGPTPLSAASIRSTFLMARAELAGQGIRRMRAGFAEAVRLEGGEGEFALMARVCVARADYLAGKLEAAKRQFDVLLAETEGLGADETTHGNLALIACDRGEWDEAARLLGEAMSLEVRAPNPVRIDVAGFRDVSYHSGWLDLLLPRLRMLAHEGDPETMAVARDIAAFSERMVHHAPWVMLFLWTTLGEVALEQGDLAAAREWAASAAKVLAVWPDAGMYGRRCRDLQHALAQRVLADPLSPAEQRVLELLPTHLSNEAIAERLHLSRNTVKSHLSAIYRKLEVDSRPRAVEEARELGLLKR